MCLQTIRIFCGFVIALDARFPMTACVILWLELTETEFCSGRAKSVLHVLHQNSVTANRLALKKEFWSLTLQAVEYVETPRLVKWTSVLLPPVLSSFFRSSHSHILWFPNNVNDVFDMKLFSSMLLPACSGKMLRNKGRMLRKKQLLSWLFVVGPCWNVQVLLQMWRKQFTKEGTLSFVSATWVVKKPPKNMLCYLFLPKSRPKAMRRVPSHF